MSLIDSNVGTGTITAPYVLITGVGRVEDLDMNLVLAVSELEFVISVPDLV